MRKIISGITLLIALFPAFQAAAFTATYHISATDIRKGYINEKIWLTQYAMPQIQLSALQYKDNVILPKEALPSSPDKFDVVLGMERKRPFAIIHIPAYTASAPTQIKQLSDFTITVNEQASEAKQAAAKTTDVTTSILASGTWYKIAVTHTGLYKIDYNFLTKLGVSPASVNTANVRVFGNGGNMLSENNAAPRINDLAENAIWMNDGGDGKFDQNDFLVFYAVGPEEWDKDSVNQRFTHQNNLYSDTAYYFINFDLGNPGLRIASQSGTLTGNKTVTDFNDYAVHDTDLVNPGDLGREWYGEQFGDNPGQNNSQTFQFNFSTVPSSVYCSVLLGSAATTGNNIFTVSLNGQVIGTENIGTTATGDPVTELYPITATAPLNSQSANINISFQPGASNTSGYLNYIELNMRRPLGISGAQMNFRDWQSVGAGNVATYQLQGANSATQVWDVTNPQVPVLMTGTLNGSTYIFTQNAQRLHEFVAMNSADLYAPSYVGTVPNQNLHGAGQVDLIIVAYPGFVDAANQLASYHQQANNMKVIVATTTQIYNEFSSGSQDISAIRDFARMFYKRAGNDTTQMPKYLLLYGGASYDYKNRVPDNSNFVPVFESVESHNPDATFCTDDFYGFLDDNEDIENVGIANALDIAVSRIPARSSGDALAMINKIKSYKSAASLGAWRVADIFAAEKEDDAGTHLADAETMNTTVTTSSNNLYNATKVYVDAIPTVTTPAGARCPLANAAINGQIYNGAFLINYNGHGSQQVWAIERILTQDDFNNWNSLTKMPLLISATCEFGQYDQPTYVSAGEEVMMKNNGGAIADLITTQATFEQENTPMNAHFIATQFTRLPDGTYHTFGEAYRIAKNITYVTATDPDELANYRKFNFLGDPALLPDFPQYDVAIDSINDGVTKQVVDSVKALGSYVINGSVRDINDNVITSFNGTVSVSFYDKPITNNVQTADALETFKIQNNVIYKGIATVTNGLFSVAFIAPKDINYNYGKGKISTYADNGVTDGAGADTSTAIGGFSDNPIISNNPPVVKPYMNDSLFQNGGITGNNSVLYVALYDETGINVSGNDVGHDLVGILDGNVTQPYILNDYYQSAPNTYQRGYVYFPISGLTNGKHSIMVRAWDVNDNSAEGTVDFTVVDSDVVQVNNLVNYPNPFTDVTHFVFEHNHPEEQLDVQINIYNTAGQFVRNITQSFTPSGSRTEELTWDGTDNSGRRLPSGLYVYRLNLSTPSGIQTTAYQKLVLIR